MILEETHLKLSFTDPPLSGLELTVASMSWKNYAVISKGRELAGMTVGDAPTHEQFTAMESLIQSFSEALVEWNLRRRVNDMVSDVGTSIEDIRSLDAAVLMSIIYAWLDALAKASESQANVSVPDLPMETL